MTHGLVLVQHLILLLEAALRDAEDGIGGFGMTPRNWPVLDVRHSAP